MPPGRSSLDVSCKAEEVAVDMRGLLDKEDIIVNIGIPPTWNQPLLNPSAPGKGIPMVVALNLGTKIKHRGISIDVAQLQNILGSRLSRPTP